MQILLDYLESRPDVDSRRIGMTGVSLGGMHTWLTASLDPRVGVAAPMIGVQVMPASLLPHFCKEKCDFVVNHSCQALFFGACSTIGLIESLL